MIGDVEEAEDKLVLTLPPAAEFVALARFAVGVVAARAHFNLEEVQDLQLAVDELYASSGIFSSGASAKYLLTRKGSEVAVRLVPLLQDEPTPDGEVNGSQFELSQQLLTALVDGHGEAAEADGATYFWLRKSHRTQ